MLVLNKTQSEEGIMKKSLLHLISICGLCLLSACGGGGNPPPPTPATHFSVAASANASAGTAFNIVVTALAASGQTVTGYSGTVHFSSTDGLAVMPANSTLVDGTGTFLVTVKTMGGQTITAVDTITASINGTSSAIMVSAVVTNPVPLINLPLSPDAVIPAGSAFALKVNGTGFVSGATVKWNGNTRVTTFVSESQVTAAVLASDVKISTALL